MEWQVSGFGNAYSVERQKGSHILSGKALWQSTQHVRISEIFTLQKSINASTSALRMHFRPLRSIHLNSKLSATSLNEIMVLFCRKTT